MTPGHARSLIIGIGNPYRGDDGVGIAVVRRLRARPPSGVTILEAGGEGAALLDAWTDATNVILVDAVHSGAPPGTIHRFDAAALEIPRRFFHYSTHAFSVAEAVELARTLAQLPPCVIVYGIEGRNFAAGVGLSTEVEQAVTAVAVQVLEEMRAFQAGGTPCLKFPSQPI